MSVGQASAPPPPRERLLLHTCCGPCATNAVERLCKDYDVTLFFSNSNIAPRAEYEKRCEAARKLARACAVTLVVDDYDHDSWCGAIAGLESEPEGGRRCERCFAFNLGRTADHARSHGFSLFTTTLTTSPHKNAAVIFDVGSRLGRFLPIDLKKQGGFQRSTELSREHGLYRQNYCGCEYSLREAETNG